METQSQSATYQSRFINIHGNNIHYVDQGKGDPIVFLHGMPTSSYLWRNIIPPLTEDTRCIAPDLIGMGKSDKPDITYSVFDHIKYIDGFIEELNLNNITLVLHGWGSVIGFDIAMRHPEKIKAIAFFEAHIRPALDWDMLSLPVQQLASMLKNKKASYHAVVEDNYFLTKLLPRGMLRKLTQEELDAYSEPFTTKESRKPLWQYLQELPLGDNNTDVVKLIEAYSKKLQQSDVPKLMLYAIPGFITTIDTVRWAKEHLSNLTLVDLGEALHFAQESVPEQFSTALLDWYQQL